MNLRKTPLALSIAAAMPELTRAAMQQNRTFGVLRRVVVVENFNGKRPPVYMRWYEGLDEVEISHK